jgi:hypothetical protein
MRRLVWSNEVYTVIDAQKRVEAGQST